jgi:hypothetical protein
VGSGVGNVNPLIDQLAVRCSEGGEGRAPGWLGTEPGNDPASDLEDAGAAQADDRER